MKITDREIDQAYSELRSSCGGVRNDYFGLLYLEKEFKIPREEAVNYIAFGGNDYGVDGFYFDRERKNFYIFQFKNTTSYTQFKDSFKRLISDGMPRIFCAETQDLKQNQILLQLYSSLAENKAIIERVYIHFVFMGEPAEAERSQVLDNLREDLENKKYLIDRFFGRDDVKLCIEFRSAQTRKVGVASHQRTTRTYTVELSECLSSQGPNNEKMLIGFIRLIDLWRMFNDMGTRFFERNIRFALPETESVNRALSKAFKSIILDGKDKPSVFAFNHNGVCLAAENVEKLNGQYKITEPRLINGVQTITTFERFIKANEDNPTFRQNRSLLEQLRVICKIITDADKEFVTSVTINNNRQNPVEPWNLRANDFIQLELHDKFLNDLGIYYERQERAFEYLSDEELEEQGIVERKPIQLYKLAQTFLVSDGEIDKLSQMRRVFEDDRIYEQVFSKARLKADSRKIVLCYKIQFRLPRLINDIWEKGPRKYDYVKRARLLLWALLCQGLLNDRDVEQLAEDYGRNLVVEANYTNYLSWLATARCRFLFDDLVNHKDNLTKIEEGKFSFLRTKASYELCMEFAYKRWRWVEKRLK